MEILNRQWDKIVALAKVLKDSHYFDEEHNSIARNELYTTVMGIELERKPHDSDTRKSTIHSD